LFGGGSGSGRDHGRWGGERRASKP
jgi:hypothetical protein